MIFVDQFEVFCCAALLKRGSRVKGEGQLNFVLIACIAGKKR